MGESLRQLKSFAAPFVGLREYPRDAVADIIAYHDRTKHHPERYANGPGGLDWAHQQTSFRRFSGAPVLRLMLAGPDDTPTAATLFGAGVAAVQSDQPLRYSRWSRLLAGFEFKILPLSVSYSTGHELVGDEERFLVAAA